MSNPQAGQPPVPKKRKPKNAKKVAPKVKAGQKRARSVVKAAAASGQFRTKEIEEIAKSITIPLNSNPVRYASEYSSLPTAVANPWTLFPGPAIGSVTNTQANPQGMPTTDGLAAVFRDPQRAIVCYDPNPASLTQLYDIYGVGDNAIPAPPPSTTWQVKVATPNTPYYLKTPYALSDPTATYSPHGPIQYAGADKSNKGRFFWLDRVNINLSISGSVSGQTCTLSLCRWDGNGTSDDVISVSHVLVSATAFQLQVLASGYYCLRLSHTAADVLNIIQPSWTGSSAVFKHLPLPGLLTNVASTDGIRIIAASMMYSNEASVLNKQGKITGFQQPQGSHWFDFIGAYSSFSTQQGSVTMPVENGMYGYMKLTQPSDFEMRENFLIEGGNVLDSFYPLDQDSAFLMMYWQITNLAGQDGYWTICHGIEYQTEDVWRTVSEAEYDGRTYSDAVESLKFFPQFYENPLHFADIWNNIKSVASDVANGILKWGPYALKGAALIGSVL